MSGTIKVPMVLSILQCKAQIIQFDDSETRGKRCKTDKFGIW